MAHADCNEQNKYERTSGRTIWKLTLPQMLMMFFHFGIGFVDVYVAGLLGRDVQAGLGMITQSLMFFMIIAVALSNGTVASVGQSLGACKNRRAGRYIGLSLQVGLVFSGVILLLGSLFKGLFLDLLQVPQPIRPITDYLLTVYLLLLPIYYMLIITNSVFRAHRLVHVPMTSMIIITVLNGLADFGLGLGLWGLPNMGFKGLAWATVVSVSCGVAFNVITMRRYGMLVRKNFPQWRWIKRGIGYMWKVAWPAGGMQVLWQSGSLALFAVTAALPFAGVDALAGLTAGLRVEAVLFLPGFAFNLTASILTGNLIGTGNFAEAKRTGLRILLFGCTGISLLAVILWSQVEPVAGLLTESSAVKGHIIDYLMYNFLAIPFTVGSMIMGGIMAGAGATLYNLLIIGGTIWCIRVPAAYVLGHLVLQRPEGIWAAMLISQIVQSSLLFYVLTTKNWGRFGMRSRKNGPPTDTNKGVGKNVASSV